MRAARSAPAPTVWALVLTLASTALALLTQAAGDASDARRAGLALLFFTGLFALRVAGQLIVVASRPRWLPPMEQWNLLPYRILLPIQLVLLAAMLVVDIALVAGADRFLVLGDGAGGVLVAAALLYWAGMGVRYVVRMARRPSERWFGGAIPIVFHCVLAAWLCVLGLFHGFG